MVLPVFMSQVSSMLMFFVRHVQAYCEENYAKCIQWSGPSAGYLEPAPDYTNPTGRGSGDSQQSLKILASIFALLCKS